MSPKKTDRNKEIVKDFLEARRKGESVLYLIMKYRISSARIYQIIRDNGITLDNSK